MKINYQNPQASKVFILSVYILKTLTPINIAQYLFFSVVSIQTHAVCLQACKNSSSVESHDIMSWNTYDGNLAKS